MDVRGQYEAKKAADARRAQERQPTPWWWLRQRDPIARFTKWLAIYTFFLAVATLANAIILHFTDEKIGAQVQQLRHQLMLMEADQRPWIGAPKITLIKTGDAIDFVLSFTNVGRTPTYSFVIDGAIFDQSDGDAGVICTEWDGKINLPGNRLSVVPRSPWVIKLSDTPKSLNKTYHVSNIESLMKPKISGCAIYTTAFNKIPRHTGFWADLTVRDGEISVGPVYTANTN